MKIQCDVCEKAEAALLCCADEAALCWTCDEKVHAANKLAGKHQRVPLFFAPTSAPANCSRASAATANHQMPTCDICQLGKASYKTPCFTDLEWSFRLFIMEEGPPITSFVPVGGALAYLSCANLSLLFFSFYLSARQRCDSRKCHSFFHVIVSTVMYMSEQVARWKWCYFTSMVDEKAGYFFCLEDRALLCRNCDVGIHASTPYGSSHQRFLITGVRVALQHYLADNSNTGSNDDRSSNSSRSNNGNGNVDQIMPQPLSNSVITDEQLVADQGEGLREQWMWNEVFDCADFGQCYGISDPGSSS